MNQNHICSICPKNDAKNPNAVCCDICSLSVHIKFNIITYNFYRKLGNDKETWNFKKCIKIIVPLSQLSDNQINNLILGSLMTSPKQITQENQAILQITKLSHYK